MGNGESLFHCDIFKNRMLTFNYRHFFFSFLALLSFPLCLSLSLCVCFGLRKFSFSFTCIAKDPQGNIIPLSLSFSFHIFWGERDNISLSLDSHPHNVFYVGHMKWKICAKKLYIEEKKSNFASPWACYHLLDEYKEIPTWSLNSFLSFLSRYYRWPMGRTGIKGRPTRVRVRALILL